MRMLLALFCCSILVPSLAQEKKTEPKQEIYEKRLKKENANPDYEIEAAKRARQFEEFRKQFTDEEWAMKEFIEKPDFQKKLVETLEIGPLQKPLLTSQLGQATFSKKGDSFNAHLEFGLKSADLEWVEVKLTWNAKEGITTFTAAKFIDTVFQPVQGYGVTRTELSSERLTKGRKLLEKLFQPSKK